MFHLVQRAGRAPQLHVEAEGTARAAAETVWALVCDADSYPRWGPWSGGGFRSRGDQARAGVGAIRWFRYGRTTTVEEVLAAEVGKRLVYTVVSGIPVRNYLAEVTLSPTAEGTHIRWSARWDRTLGGRVVHRTLRRLYPDIVRRLAAAAERVPAGTGPAGHC